MPSRRDRGVRRRRLTDGFGPSLAGGLRSPGSAVGNADRSLPARLPPGRRRPPVRAGNCHARLMGPPIRRRGREPPMGNLRVGGFPCRNRSARPPSGPGVPNRCRRTSETASSACVAADPVRDGTTMANGFAGLGVDDGVEGFARVPFALGADISLDGVRLSMAPDRVAFVEQRYDFETAELSTVLDFRVGDVTARIEVLQLCNHRLPTIVQQELRITTDRAADLKVGVGLDPTGVEGAGEYPDRPSGRRTDTEPQGVILWHSHGDITTCGLAYWSEVLGTSDAERADTRRDDAVWSPRRGPSEHAQIARIASGS